MIPWEGTLGGAQRDPMGGDPWEREPLGAQGIPWEGVPDPPWEGNPGSPKDPMGGDPWGPNWNPLYRYFMKKLPSNSSQNHENLFFDVQ